MFHDRMTSIVPKMTRRFSWRWVFCHASFKAVSSCCNLLNNRTFTSTQQGINSRCLLLIHNSLINDRSQSSLLTVYHKKYFTTKGRVTSQWIWETEPPVTAIHTSRSKLFPIFLTASIKHKPVLHIISVHTENSSIIGDLMSFSSKSALTGCHLDFPSSFNPNWCILSGQLKSFYILFNTIQLNLSQTLSRSISPTNIH